MKKAGKFIVRALLTSENFLSQPVITMLTKQRMEANTL